MLRRINLSSLYKFPLHAVEAIGKLKNKVKNKIKFEKNVQVQLMSFYYINVETIGKCKNVKENKFVQLV